MTRGRDDVPLLPAYLDDERTVKCGLPAEVRCRFTMRSTDGPLESAMIRCPAGHRFNGTIESLTWDSANKHNPGTAAAPSVAGHGRLPRTRDGRDSQGGVALDEFPAGPGPAAPPPELRSCLLSGTARPPVDHRHAAQPHRIQPPRASRHRWRGGNTTSGWRPPARHRGRNRPYDTCHCAVAEEGKDRYGRHGPAACRHHRSLLGHRCPVRRPPGRRRTEPGVGTWFRFGLVIPNSLKRTTP
jgi:hypothetical protein